jgi:hypothetical protein
MTGKILGPQHGKYDKFIALIRAFIFCEENKGLIYNWNLLFQRSAHFQTHCSMQQFKPLVFKYHRDLHFFQENQRFQNKIIEYAHNWQHELLKTFMISSADHTYHQCRRESLVLYNKPFNTLWFTVITPDIVSYQHKWEQPSQNGSYGPACKREK